MTQNGKGPAKNGRETVTCDHCRYEYDAGLAQCPICGYPWPWLTQEDD